MHVTSYRRRNLFFVLVSAACIVSGIQKRIILRLIESNYSKDSSIQTMHLVKLKFSMCIIGHYRTNPTNFGEWLLHSFFFFNRVQKKEFLHMESMCLWIKFFKEFNPGRACRPSRSEFSVVISETRVNAGKVHVERPPRRPLSPQAQVPHADNWP